MLEPLSFWKNNIKRHITYYKITIAFIFFIGVIFDEYKIAKNETKDQNPCGNTGWVFKIQVTSVQTCRPNRKRRINRKTVINFIVGIDNEQSCHHQGLIISGRSRF